MNKAAAELLDTPDYIELYFDDDTQRMGIGVGESDSPSAYRLRKQDSDSWLFSGAAFCQFYRIDTGTTRRYAVQMDGELLVLDFNSEPMVVKSRREAANGQAEAA